MFIDWLLKTDDGNIAYDQLKMMTEDGTAGISENGNLSSGQTTTTH